MGILIFHDCDLRSINPIFYVFHFPSSNLYVDDIFVFKAEDCVKRERENCDIRLMDHQQLRSKMHLLNAVFLYLTTSDCNFRGNIMTMMRKKVGKIKSGIFVMILRLHFSYASSSSSSSPAPPVIISTNFLVSIFPEASMDIRSDASSHSAVENLSPQVMRA